MSPAERANSLLDRSLEPATVDAQRPAGLFRCGCTPPARSSKDIPEHFPKAESPTNPAPHHAWGSVYLPRTKGCWRQPGSPACLPLDLGDQFLDVVQTVPSLQSQSARLCAVRLSLKRFLDRLQPDSQRLVNHAAEWCSKSLRGRACAIQYVVVDGQCCSHVVHHSIIMRDVKASSSPPFGIAVRAEKEDTDALPQPP